MIPPVITVVDFETTRPSRDTLSEPWQVGIIQLRNGVPDPSSKWFSYLRVRGKPTFSGVTPTRAELCQMEQSLTLPELLPTLLRHYLCYPLAAHHAAVERNILRHAAPLHDFGVWIDTLELAKQHLPGLHSYALCDLCRQLGLQGPLQSLCPGLAPHNALYDACACALLLQFLQNSYSAITRYLYSAQQLHLF